ncbi:DUF4268 domain-containing protein [Flavimaricola marinus]|uniref:Endonuclease NucS n=1 Tax=Flavimaricola marinus TaxID=1819565 RepID=A0A238LMX1_9RHOB|nr:DUF4268 domain-containing protein [Flavimaricola marinus]SMY10266.1 Endonuclease NucS [Flavimaricola marinus]
MFQVNRSENRLRKLEERRFSDLALREREHLQEWLANQPDALGEDLLIIQKEFDGFADTRERLDLLALDKDGQLVVIENKLDDSGRDVAWQALKYAAYVSSLTKTQIIDIFQSYLNRYRGGGSAVSLVCEFLEVEEMDEVVLNAGQSQRLIFIAAKFRKEVTSTVLWLREHRIDARCFKVVPYVFADELFVDIQPVIPTPEAADFMISMAEKETEEKSAKGVQRWSHEVRQEFWERLLETFQSRGLERWQNIGASKDHWLTSSTGASSCNLVLIFLRHEIRVELQLNRSNAEKNKGLFDQLAANANQYDTKIDTPLDWRRMDDKKVSIISCKQPVQGYTKENWPDMIEWLAEHYRQMEQAFAEPVRKLATQARSGDSVRLG